MQWLLVGGLAAVEFVGTWAILHVGTGDYTQAIHFIEAARSVGYASLFRW